MPPAIAWFEDSPDAGDPRCICSWCGDVIGSREWEEQNEEYDEYDFPCEPEFPIRFVDTQTGKEARFHVLCLQALPLTTKHHLFGIQTRNDGPQQ